MSAIYGALPKAIGMVKDAFFYQDNYGRLFGVGANDSYRLDQNTAAGMVNWPSKELWFMFP